MAAGRLRVDVVLSRHILDEMARILPRLSRVKLSPAEIRDLVDSFMFLADVVDPDGEQDSLLRDLATSRCWSSARTATSSRDSPLNLRSSREACFDVRDAGLVGGEPLAQEVHELQPHGRFVQHEALDEHANPFTTDRILSLTDRVDPGRSVT